jgi:hypothetical protein
LVEALRWIRLIAELRRPLPGKVLDPQQGDQDTHGSDQHPGQPGRGKVLDHDGVTPLCGRHDLSQTRTATVRQQPAAYGSRTPFITSDPGQLLMGAEIPGTGW